jgi:hypothetical protein
LNTWFGDRKDERMSLADSLKGLVDKGKEAAAKNAGKINEAVDKAGDFVDQKTGGKYSDKIDKVQEAAKKAVPTDKPAPGEPPAPPASPAEEPGQPQP